MAAMTQSRHLKTCDLNFIVDDKRADMASSGVRKQEWAGGTYVGHAAESCTADDEGDEARR